MATLRVIQLLSRPVRYTGLRAMSTGSMGEGAGKGGGSGGSIRDAGGAFGKMEAAHEEQYFRKLAEEQLKDYKKHVSEQKHFHAEEIKKHEEAINRHKKMISELKDGSSSD